MRASTSETDAKIARISAKLRGALSNDAPFADIALRIVQARTEYGLNQKELAEELGLTPRQWGEYEKGRVSPYRRLRKIADVTKVSYEWLLRGDEPFQATTPTSHEFTAAALIIAAAIDNLTEAIRRAGGEGQT